MRVALRVRPTALHGPFEPMGDPVRVFGAAFRPAKDKVQVSPVRAVTAMPLAPGPRGWSQHVDRVLEHVARSASSRARSPAPVLVGVEAELLLHADRVRVPLHVGPAKAQRRLGTRTLHQVQRLKTWPWRAWPLVLLSSRGQAERRGAVPLDAFQPCIDRQSPEIFSFSFGHPRSRSIWLLVNGTAKLGRKPSTSSRCLSNLLSRLAALLFRPLPESTRSQP